MGIEKIKGLDKAIQSHKENIKKKFEAPICPECKKALYQVYETIYENYFFNAKTGQYIEAGIGSLIATCPNCNTDITDIFEEGVCNYQITRRTK